MLSGKNARSIQTGLNQIHDGAELIGAVLVAAGVIDPEYVEESESEEAEGREAVLETASRLSQKIAYQTWMSTLHDGLETFTRSFCDFHYSDFYDLADPTVSSEDRRRTKIAEAIADIEDFLREHSKAYPQMGTGLGYYPYYDPHPHPTPLYASKEEEVTAIMAGSIADEIDRNAWRQKMWTVRSAVIEQYVALHQANVEELEKAGIAGEQGRTRAIASLIDDFVEMLKEMAADPPPAYPVPKTPLIAAEADKVEAEEPDAVAPEVEPEAEWDLSEGASIEASGIEFSTEFHLSSSIEASEADVEIQVEANSNLYPVQGTLFRIDEPSEMAPSVGPKLPLYVPREVAEKVLDVASLPLEASTSLVSHERQGTCGVMTRAEIAGSRFIVHGYLWGHNHADKVSQILAAADDLGMSMNANAKGRVAIVDGRKVFWITDMELLGGCILMADAATYQTTDFGEAIAASASVDDSSEWQPIAAGSGDDLENPNPETPEGDLNDMELQQIEAQMTAMSEAVVDLGGVVRDELRSLSGTLSDLRTNVDLLMAERNASIEATAARNQQQQTQQQQDVLVEAMADVITGKIQELQNSLPQLVRDEVSSLRNARGVPARATAPVTISAGAGATAPTLTPEQVELRNTEITLESLRAANSPDNQLRLKLTQRARELRVGLQAQGLAPV